MLSAGINDFTRSHDTELKKKKIIERIIGNKDYFIEDSYDTIYIDKDQFITFDIYCSQDLMRKILKK